MRNSEFGLRSKIVPATLIVLSLFAAFAFAGQDQRIAERLKELSALKGPFSFIVLGDNRSGGEVYRKIVGMAIKRKPDLMINTGDQITDPGDRRQWAAFWQLSGPVNMPYFLTVGNHDVKDRESEEIFRDEVDLPGNELYYTFTAGNARFIVLNTSRPGEQKRVTGEQYAWLDEVLAKAKEQHRFLFLHHPLYPEKGRGKHHGNSLDRYPEDRDRLQALFQRHRVTMVFAGHEHLYHRKKVGGITHIMTGGGGAPLYAADDEGGFHHFIHMRVDGSRVSGEVVSINGKVRDRFEL